MWRGLLLIIGLNTGFLSAQSSLVAVPEFGANLGSLECLIQPTSTKNRPLILVLHGCTQSAQEAISVSGWDALAKENDFFLLAPQQRIGNNPNRCFNWFRPEDIDSLNGEAASILNMLSYCLTHFSIDTSQIFITGFSAGGQMSVSLLALTPARFKGGAVFACGPYGLAEKPGQALKAMHGQPELTEKQLTLRVMNLHPETALSFPSLYIYHGLDDGVVYPNCAVMLYMQWRGIKQLNASPEKEVLLKEHPFIQRTSVGSTDNYNRVVLYQCTGLGHQIPVDPGTNSGQGGQYNLFSKDQNFWAAMNVAIDFGLVKVEGQ
ncbi:MAG: PHB depolymerase family esterase [Cryomorphaceae bacterium]|nr:PHB depolymerase family esterase [Cryomorphaceae bacterium]